jgi:hypothetical protein
MRGADVRFRCRFEFVETITRTEAVLHASVHFRVTLIAFDLHPAHWISARRRPGPTTAVVPAVAGMRPTPESHHEEKRCGKYQETDQTAHTFDLDRIVHSSDFVQELPYAICFVVSAPS